MPLMMLFVLWPLVEIALFVQIGGAIGLWPTLAIVIGTAVLGGWLLRRRGAVALRDVQSAVQEFRDPSAPMANGALLMLAAVLLMLPGFLTDALGLMLLIPPVRALLLRWTGRRIAVRSRPGFAPAPHRYARGAVIDADYVDETDFRPPSAPTKPEPESGPHRPSGWTRGPEAH